jgi:hypothetical protein
VSSAPPEGYWVLDDRPYHLACAPWQGRPFPYAWALDEARRALTSLRGAGQEPPDDFERALRWLEEAAHRWPTPRPAALLGAAAKAVAIVERTKRGLEASR